MRNGDEMTHDGADDQRQAGRERQAQDLLLDAGAHELPARPWRPEPMPPSSGDLVQYALWRSSELTSAELFGALTLLPASRAETDGAEVGLIFAARSAGLTWSQIAEAMNFRSPQACQQHVNRLASRQEKRG